LDATLITVGDELLIGQVVNTNAAWLGEHLGLVGVPVRRTATVGDDAPAIGSELTRALEETDVVIVTGGLGPTHDDVTKRAIADVLGRALAFRDDVWAELEEKYRSRGREPGDSARVMAEVPDGFEPLFNPAGSAPGLWGEVGTGESPRVVIVLPGVPREMRSILEAGPLDRLRGRSGRDTLLHKTLLTAGKGESDLAAMIGSLDDDLGPDLSLAFLPSYGGVRLRLTARAADPEAAARRIAPLEARIREVLGDLIYGDDDDSLEAAVGRMLVERGLTVAVAESCSGGRLSAQIVGVPGASRYFVGGVVAYSNGMKREIIGVDEATLAAHGAVSEPTALQMAAGVREVFGSDIGLATTGIAGPGGGTPDKPVGTVWLAYDDGTTQHAAHVRLPGDRAVITRLSVHAALNLLRRQLIRG
jgi:nicotinamide-nucleotide amidase